MSRSCLIWIVFLPALLGAQSDFVNWETPQVHPIDLTPSGNLLLGLSVIATSAVPEMRMQARYSHSIACR